MRNDIFMLFNPNKTVYVQTVPYKTVQYKSGKVYERTKKQSDTKRSKKCPY